MIDVASLFGKTWLLIPGTENDSYLAILRKAMASFARDSFLKTT
jgi:hypothetical protein